MLQRLWVDDPKGLEPGEPWRQWNNEAANCRSGNRNTNEPTNRNNYMGFRLALNSAGEWWKPEFPDGTDRFPVPAGTCMLGEI